MDDETPQPTAIKAGRGGIIPPVEHRFKPGNRANPGGHPKGFFPLSRAYEDIMSWPREVKRAFLAGDEAAMPVAYRRKLKSAHDTARAMLLRAEDPENRTGVGAAVEIADRTEGKVKTTTDMNVRGQSISDLVAQVEKESSGKS